MRDEDETVRKAVCPYKDLLGPEKEKASSKAGLNP